MSSDLNKLTGVMDRAFADDPTVNWVVPDREDFLSLHHKFVEVWAEPAFEYGGVHAFDDYSGAAIWFRPGLEFDDAELVRMGMSASTPDRFSAFFDLVEACGKFRPTERYWELEMLAIDPPQQGHGLGAQLLRYGLDKCDREGCPVYLESSNPANLSFYRRHGFELLSEVHLSGTPKRFPMLRPAS